VCNFWVPLNDKTLQTEELANHISRGEAIAETKNENMDKPVKKKYFLICRTFLCASYIDVTATTKDLPYKECPICSNNRTEILPICNEP
jgi:hypothetical protein